MATEANVHLSEGALSIVHVEAIMQLDALLPSQYFGPRRKQAPEQRLMIAVLHDAIDCVEKYRFATNRDGRLLFEEAEQWFLSDETNWPYSFECICDVLDLDSNAVRHRLRMSELPIGRPSDDGRSWL